MSGFLAQGTTGEVGDLGVGNPSLEIRHRRHSDEPGPPPLPSVPICSEVSQAEQVIASILQLLLPRRDGGGLRPMTDQKQTGLY
jgi:hypothetical protein